MATQAKRVTATGLAVAGPAILYAAVLCGGSAASEALIEDTAAGSGTALIELQAVATGQGDWSSSRGVYFKTGVYITLAGASATAWIEYEKG